MRKLLMLAAVLAASAAGLAAAVPASASPSNAPAVHVSAVSPDVPADQQLCDAESSPLCMAGHDGLNGQITAQPHATGVAETIHIIPDTGMCNNGRVSAVTPCPFADGSGLNSKYNNDFIVQIQNADNKMFYRANGAHVVESNNGDGQLWVQGTNHPLAGEASNTQPFININETNNSGILTGACANGNGSALLMQAVSIAASPAECSWIIVGPLP